MRTIDDISFDQDYSHGTFRFLLPKNQASPSVVVTLPHALLMTFIQVFPDVIQCQQYITNNNQRMITLVISNRSIIDWHNHINTIDNNINKIYIFCDTYYDYIQMRKWNGCYRNQIRDVYLPDQVDYELLRLGVDYIRTIMPEVRETRGLYRKFCTDAQRLLGALTNYFQNQIDSLGDDGSEENQS